MNEIEAQQQKCANIIKKAINQHRDEQKLIDDELTTLFKENRKKMKSVADYITKRYFG